MANLEIRFERHDHLNEFEAIFQEEARAEMTVVLEQTTGLVQQLAPVGVTSTFRNSITNSGPQSPEPGVVTGSVFSQDDPIKVGVIEGVDQQGNETPYGRRPGFYVPKAPIMQWAAKVLGLSGRALARAVYFIRKKIKAEGILPQRPFKIAYSMKEEAIRRSFEEDVPARIAKRL